VIVISGALRYSQLRCDFFISANTVPLFRVEQAPEAGIYSAVQRWQMPRHRFPSSLCNGARRTAASSRHTADCAVGLNTGVPLVSPV